jgi:DNA-binding transcriptional LysR family regulator
MDLNEILVFARVARAGSFTAAAKELGMPKSTVSRKVTELEERLDARLLQRTTRKLSLTDAGRTYYDYAARIANELEAAERAVGSLQAKPQGLLRVTAPVNVGFLSPIISDYLKRYPDVHLDLFCTARSVDLVEERFDLAIRAGALADSSLIAKSLGSAKWFVVAAPGYLKKYGRPRLPEELKSRACLLFGNGRTSVHLTFVAETRTAELDVEPRLLTSDMDVLFGAVAAGLGIGLLPAFVCVEALRAGRMERVLHEWQPPAVPMQVVYPTTRHLSPKVKTFVDHLQQRMTPPPWELGPTP